MRSSPHELRKMLAALFPQGPSRTGEVHLNFTPSPQLLASGEFSATPSALRQTPSPPPSPATAPSMPTKDLEIEMGRFAPSGPTTLEGKRKRRKPMLAIALLGAVVAVVVVVLPRQTTVRPPDVSAAPVAAAQAPAPPEPAPPPPVKTTVEISLDSTPQDALVIREDSGEEVGRTPVAIKLAQGRDVITFRFEKAGHTTSSYKVIPDLDKAVRAELEPEPVPVEPKHQVAANNKGRPGRGGRAAPHDTKSRASDAKARPTEEPAPAAEAPRSCLLSVGSFPWAELWIDGKDTGQRTPVLHYPVSCGAHKLNLKRRDLKLDRTEQVTVAPGHENKQHYDFGDEYGE